MAFFAYSVYALSIECVICGMKFSKLDSGIPAFNATDAKEEENIVKTSRTIVQESI